MREPRLFALPGAAQNGEYDHPARWDRNVDPCRRYPRHMPVEARQSSAKKCGPVNADGAPPGVTRRRFSVKERRQEIASADHGGNHVHTDHGVVWCSAHCCPRGYRRFDFSSRWRSCKAIPEDGVYSVLPRMLGYSHSLPRPTRQRSLRAEDHPRPITLFIWSEPFPRFGPTNPVR